MTAPHAFHPPAKPSWLTTLGWAAYLGMSWTWCIGMFLPVLLVRDYGIWGFVVFAVPNVVGAAAMGWVLKRGASARIVERHRAAMVVFSAVTVVFQFFFLVWITNAASIVHDAIVAIPRGTSWWGFGISFALSSAVGWLARRVRGDRLVAIVLWTFSAVTFGYLLASGMLDYSMPLSRGGDAPRGIALLAPVCIFGFALCPYLDGTFHHAITADKSQQWRASFTLGFGVLFFAMILFTLGYSTAFLPIATGLPAAGPTPPLLQLVILHMVFQIAFTVWLHARWALKNAGPSAARKRLIVLAGAVPLGALVWGITLGLPRHAGLSGEEVMYRSFMAFYGLLFPAYVWLCMIPTRDDHSGIVGPRGRWKLIVLGVVVLLAAPCFWMGFIERQEWWLAPGLGIVLLARLLVRGPEPVSVPA